MKIHFVVLVCIAYKTIADSFYIQVNAFIHRNEEIHRQHYIITCKLKECEKR